MKVGYYKKLVGWVKNTTHKNNFQPRWYAIFFHPQFTTRRPVFLSILSFSKTINRKKILDVGCGESPYRNLFSDSDYTGVDIEGGGHDDSIKKPDKYYDGSTLPFPDAQFDVVIFTGVIEHTENPDRILSEIFRVLKPNSILYLMSPFAADEHAIPFDFIRLTSFGLKKILLKHGFLEPKIEKTSGIFASIGQLLSTFLFDEFFKTFKIGGYGKRFIIQKFFAVLVCSPIQISSLFLDMIFHKKGMPLCYIAISKKP